MAASIWSPGSSQQVPALPAVAPVSFVKGTVGNPGINFVGDIETGIWSETDGYLNFVCNGITQLRIDPTGNITGNKFIGGAELQIASASVTDIGSLATNSVQITGTSTITSFGVNYRGPMFVRFQSALTLTHNATTLILPGAANISVMAGDTCIVVPKALSGISNGWIVFGYQRVSGLLPGYAASGANTDITSISGSAAALDPTKNYTVTTLSANSQVTSTSPNSGNAGAVILRDAAGNPNKVYLQAVNNGNSAQYANLQFDSTGVIIASGNFAASGQFNGAGTGLIGTANSLNAGIGVNQTWQNLTASRASGTTYTNTTGKPIMILMGRSATDVSPSLTVTINGLPAVGWGGAFYANPTSYGDALSLIIPNNNTYAATNFLYWYELR